MELTVVVSFVMKLVNTHTLNIYNTRIDDEQWHWVKTCIFVRYVLRKLLKFKINTDSLSLDLNHIQQI